MQVLRSCIRKTPHADRFYDERSARTVKSFSSLCPAELAGHHLDKQGDPANPKTPW